jgi:hypothetical protein
MLTDWVQSLQERNFITIIIIFILLGSVLQGILRGASRSANQLLTLVGGGVLSIVGIALSLPLTMWMAPVVQNWLVKHVVIPTRDLSLWEKTWYTFVTAIRDFPLMRFAIVFLAVYWLIRIVLAFVQRFIFEGATHGFKSTSSLTSFGRIFGGMIGFIIGAARSLVIIVILFIVVILMPESKFSHYVQASPPYQEVANRVIKPLAGNLIEEKLPVFTRTVGQELNGMWQRKYEVIDANISTEIEETAIKVTYGASSDEEKARKLYDWVGKQIVYDNNKVKDYEEKGIWHEQTPQMTYDTKRGVCIDYSRLYAIMARSQGLQVKVVTGLGYDGKGGYGPHAWNEVYLSESNRWIPLDSTWANSGDWFNPPKFSDTHVADKLVSGI